MFSRLLNGAALAALLSVAAPAAAASFIGDTVTMKRLQGGSYPFPAQTAVVGSGAEFNDGFFDINITENEVIFSATGGYFSMGDIAYEFWGLDFDDNAATPNIVQAFSSHQMFSDYAPIDINRATIETDGRFKMSFAQVRGGTTAVARVTFGAPTSPVPEPATWAMMISGFGVVGAALRARRREARLAAA